MEKRKYELQGRVVDRSGGRGIAAILVEAWDKDQKYDDVLGSAITDAEGRFTLYFDSSAFADSYRDTDPDVYFKLFFEGALVESTEKNVIRNWKNGKDEIIIPIAAPRRNEGQDFFRRMSKDLKSEMDGLVKHERTIVERLKEPEMAKLFAENPLRALNAMNIPIPPLLKKKIKEFPGASALLNPRSFRLPNGQLITPKVNIRFTERKEAADVR